MIEHVINDLRARLRYGELSGRVRAAFAPRKPRNVVLRVLLGLLGLGLLAVLLVIGVMVGALMLVAGMLMRLFRPRSAASRESVRSDPRVIDAQYRVVSSKPAAPHVR